MTADTTRFCGICGAARESLALKFCRQCGAAFGAVAPLTPVPTPATAPAAAALFDARRRPRWVVALLGLFGSATYGFWWLWMSWRELKRIRGEASMAPFWHAFACFAVPLYGLFRFHAHFRTIDELNARAGIPVRAGAGLATLVFFLLISVLWSGIALSAAAASTGQREVGLQPLSLLVVGTGYAFIVRSGQEALNAYYASLSGQPIPERPHALELVFIALFVASFSAQIYVATGGRI